MRRPPISTLFPYTNALPIYADVDRVARMVGDLRDAVGPDIDIMVDFHGRPASANAAMAYIDAIADARIDRKSTRLNSSHVEISYAVFCLKKKNKKIIM